MVMVAAKSLLGWCHGFQQPNAPHSLPLLFLCVKDLSGNKLTGPLPTQLVLPDGLISVRGLVGMAA